MKGKFIEQNLNKYEEIKDYISDNGDIGYRYYNGEKKVIE
jgi:hypothetical protein